jgi:hypothetical protein
MTEDGGRCAAIYRLWSIVYRQGISFDALKIRTLHLSTKFLALPPSERWLLIQAALLVLAARLGLWLLPFRAVPSVLERLAWLIARRSSMRVAPERIAWAVVAVSPYIPLATCLTQALAARALLARLGYSALLRIGVARAAHGQIAAHAWVELDGRAIIGGAISGRYVPLPGVVRPTMDDRQF